MVRGEGKSGHRLQVGSRDLKSAGGLKGEDHEQLGCGGVELDKGCGNCKLMATSVNTLTPSVCRADPDKAKKKYFPVALDWTSPLPSDRDS